MKRYVSVAMVTTILWLLAGVSAAHDHRPPPRARLLSGGERQLGRQIHSEWTRRSGRFCITTFADGFLRFPKAMPYAPSEDVVLRLRKEAMPLEWQLQAWTEVSKDGYPKGDPETVPAIAEPRVIGSQVVGWDLRFVPPLVEGDLYLLIDVHWADEDECGPPPYLGSQSMSWSYHLRT